MNQKYTIYTEDKESKDLLRLVTKDFSGFNYQQRVGVWGSVLEPSIVFEIIGTEKDLAKVVRLCHKIKLLLNQEAILLTTEPIVSRLI